MSESVNIGPLEISAYWLCLAAALAIGAAWLGHDLRGAGFRRGTAVRLTVAAVGLGFVCAKLTFFMMEFQFLFSLYGWAGLGRFQPGEFAFSGAIVGFVAAAGLTAPRQGRRACALLAAAAPAGMLFLALARFSEYFADFGTGDYVGDPSFQFFPLAVENQYQEWYGAVFVLEGLFALAIFLWMVGGRGLRASPAPDGALAWLALSQVLCESLRNNSIRWGFVRAQQVLCMAAVLALAFRYAWVLRKRGSPWGPLLLRGGAVLGSAALCVGVEFALDKTNLPAWFCYGVMAAALTAIGLILRGQRKRVAA